MFPFQGYLYTHDGKHIIEMETINGNNSNKHGNFSNKFIIFVLLGGDVGILVDNGKNIAMGK
jgi:hypothetical protein